MSRLLQAMPPLLPAVCSFLPAYAALSPPFHCWPPLPRCCLLLLLSAATPLPLMNEAERHRHAAPLLSSHRRLRQDDATT